MMITSYICRTWYAEQLFSLSHKPDVACSIKSYNLHTVYNEHINMTDAGGSAIVAVKNNSIYSSMHDISTAIAYLRTHYRVKIPFDFQ